ncbi:MAG TPA: alpha/beta hydrolase [Acidimicrobiales bacterium]
MGEAGPGPLGGGPPGDHLRPPWVRPIEPAHAGYDYDTFAADLKVVVDNLDLRDMVLAGFSMGTGEVTRYLGTYGPARVTRAALFGPIPPFLLQTDDNPKGVPQSVFDGFSETIKKDRYAWFKFFFDNFYNVDELHGTRISDEAWNASFQVAAGSSAYATLACVPTWLTDFRDDLPKIDVPCSSSRAPRTASSPSMRPADGCPSW